MDIKAIEMAKDFELFGKRIEYIEPILNKEDDGIIINELSRICKKDPLGYGAGGSTGNVKSYRSETRLQR